MMRALDLGVSWSKANGIGGEVRKWEAPFIATVKSPRIMILETIKIR